MTKDINATDRRLLSLLQSNARESVAALSRKLGIARTTVQERINRMERNGTIAGYSLIMQRDPFDLYAESVVLISISNRKMKTVTDHLREFPEIVLCQVVSGEFELVCRVRVAHLEDMQPFLEGVGEIPGVERVRSIIVLTTAFDRSHSEAATLATKQVAAMHHRELD
jgi:DNA-binding Lrp family transcriptional regulator